MMDGAVRVLDAIPDTTHEHVAGLRFVVPVTVKLQGLPGDVGVALTTMEPLPPTGMLAGGSVVTLTPVQFDTPLVVKPLRVSGALPVFAMV